MISCTSRQPLHLTALRYSVLEPSGTLLSLNLHLWAPSIIIPFKTQFAIFPNNKAPVRGAGDTDPGTDTTSGGGWKCRVHLCSPPRYPPGRGYGDSCIVPCQPHLSRSNVE